MAETKSEIKQGKASIDTTMKTGSEVVSESSTEEAVGDPKGYSEPTCNVGVSVGVTRNMGNYNSVKVQVSLNMPCYIEEIDPVYEFTKEWVDNKVDTIVAELDEE
ncbi:MAG: hypothetical protein GQ570_03515 [Helicobacteraceae bacterium]|nr:hypothetical protein [Helicobacteraceae bacterium]